MTTLTPDPPTEDRPHVWRLARRVWVVEHRTAMHVFPTHDAALRAAHLIAKETRNA